MSEQRLVLKYCGKIDPEKIQTYLDQDGFKALAKAREKMSPETVVAEISTSGLRGRGGAGFSCGTKLEMARKSTRAQKYLICNADEGEMGTFKDRHILQYDPFSLIEGIGIAAYAIGADIAYIYLREEYRYLLSRLEDAIAQVRTKGLLYDLEIKIFEGAGAYICGEESALMNSIEGHRGEARFRPPFPPISGLFKNPTIINNVETLANLPTIILKGADWFSKLGTENSKGTKVFSVSGDVTQPGIYELEMGSALKSLVVDLAGATDIKMVQIGGAAGRILPATLLDTPLAFETVLGSGAVTVFDSSRDVLEVIHQNLIFLAEESCGKCTPCREGTRFLVETLERLIIGEGTATDLEDVRVLAQVMMDTSLCGLGQGAPIPILDSIKYFSADYKNRIKQAIFLRTLTS